MDIFVRNLPANATWKQVESFFAAPFAEFGIDLYYCDKYTNKNLANITVLDSAAAQRFLDLYGVPTGAPPSVRAKKSLPPFHGKSVRCSRNREEPSKFSIRSVAFEESERARKSSRLKENQKNKQNAKLTRFTISSLQCGNWDYAESRLAFATQYRVDLVDRPGMISFGMKEAVIVLGKEGSDQRRIRVNYHDCSSIVLGLYDDPAVTFTLKSAPKFYEVAGEDVIANALLSLTLGPNAAKRKAVKKTRVTGIDDTHSKIAGVCFIYRISLSDRDMISAVRGLLSRDEKAKVTPASLSTPVVHPTEHIRTGIRRLNDSLAKLAELTPFSVLFQLDRLARNGILPPHQVIELLSTVAHIHRIYGLDATLYSLGKFYRQVPIAGPETDAHQLSTAALTVLFEESAASYGQYRYNPANPYELTKRYAHINLVQKLIVTPCGVYLEGPAPEPTDRVLRRYADHLDSFARVIFQDEDGGSVRYDPLASQSIIFHERFAGVLNSGIPIAGRIFSFFGFSHSSLRSQSCWFMSPIAVEGTLKLPREVIKELGDFTHIRVPAKCAARIGLNFTDTNATVDVQESNVGHLPMVQYGSYDFSDGVGTISHDLLRSVWKVYGQRRMLKPTVIQIRYKGFKGMVSLDSRLSGERLMLRDNMKKFEAPSAWNLEICGAGFKPRPMVLNRQFIKIFEDLGIQPSVFMDLQKIAVDKLRHMTASVTNTANFLEENECTKATSMPSLIRHLGLIGLDYRQDPFLHRVVEMVVVTNLRDIKYRSRIPIKDGVTLYGIMDETGELEEGQIYVVSESSPEGGRQVLVRDRVVVTRSPAMHPGDVQVVNAVNVSAGSPLQQLSNAVVFSQHGTRDLPSQLSGGDLDGDLFNILWDPRVIPSTTYTAADYPKVSAVELDREVLPEDMSNFFVEFMESDLLGNMQLADQSELGTFDPACIELASMASTAVDFSKTGVPVDMSECPRHNRCRPDFMAPSPRVVVSGQGHLDIEEEDDENDPAFEALDAERRAIRYYESRKTLGSLYRAIDERQFVARMQQDQREVMSSLDPSTTLLGTLLAYLKRETSEYAILYDQHKTLPRDIRAGYEDNLLDILYYYEPSPHMPVSEHEAFAGTILGRQTGTQGKPLRELSKTMRERFEAVVEYTVRRIVKGDEQMHGLGDIDLLYDEDSLDREVEALPRAMACLIVALEEQGRADRVLGPQQCFAYVVAGVCLKELERFRITTLRSYVLPRV